MSWITAPAGDVTIPIRRVGFQEKAPKGASIRSLTARSLAARMGASGFLSYNGLDYTGIYEAHAQPLFGFLVYRTGDRMLAEDGPLLHSYLAHRHEGHRQAADQGPDDGGPQGAWNDAWSTRWNPSLWAAQGWVVVAPNPSGSTTFGQEMVDRITGDWAGRVMREISRDEGIPGTDLQLTIDAELQAYVEARMEGESAAATIAATMKPEIP